VEFLLLVHGGLEALPLFRQHVEDEGMLDGLEKLKGVDEGGEIMTVDRAVVGEAEFFKNDVREDEALDRFLRFFCHMGHHGLARLAGDHFEKLLCLILQVRVAGVRHDLVEVAGDGSHVLVDRPLIVIQDNDQPLGVIHGVVQGFVSDAAGEGRISGHCDDVFLPAPEITCGGHAECGGNGGSGVPGTVAVMWAFRAEHEAVEPARLTDRVEAVTPSGEEFVDVGLVAHVEDKMIFRRVEDVVHGKGQFHHAEVGAQMSTVFAQDGDQLLANFFRELFELFDAEFFYVSRTVDRIEQGSGSFAHGDGMG